MPSMKWTYPVHIADNNCRETETSQLTFFPNHHFDFKDEHKTHRVRKEDISFGLAPLRNVEGVRKFYRTNEALILPETREGLPERQDSLVIFIYILFFFYSCKFQNGKKPTFHIQNKLMF